MRADEPASRGYDFGRVKVIHCTPPSTTTWLAAVVRHPDRRIRKSAVKRWGTARGSPERKCLWESHPPLCTESSGYGPFSSMLSCIRDHRGGRGSNGGVGRRSAVVRSSSRICCTAGPRRAIRHGTAVTAGSWVAVRAFAVQRSRGWPTCTGGTPRPPPSCIGGWRVGFAPR